MGSAMNIPELRLQIKNHGEGILAEWGVVIIVLMLGLASFGLGRLSALEGARPAVSVGQAPSEATPKGTYLGGTIVASRSGTAYHYPWCAGALQIAAQNRVWFGSEIAARSAGYAPAKNCKGLGEK